MEDKIPFYNIVNMLLTGFVFIGCCILIYLKPLTNWLEVTNLPNSWKITETIVTITIVAIIYEVGYIINRIGSLIFEPLLKWSKIVPFNDDYKKFNFCKKEFPILGILSREYALSRTSITIFLISTFLSLLQRKYMLAFIFVVISMLFLFSCRKYATKIVKLMR